MMINLLFDTGHNSKHLSAHCLRCSHLTILEGETICFEAGTITRLTHNDTDEARLQPPCEKWQQHNRT